MKTMLGLIACLLLCLCAASCGSDELLQWSCACSGGKTTFVCATNSTEAVTQAYAQICRGLVDCECACTNTYLPFGC